MPSDAATTRQKYSPSSSGDLNSHQGPARSLSFLLTTPGVWEPSLGGFPALSAVPGQFLIKDLALLGVSLWSLGEAWQASERPVGGGPGSP